jgi:hypothetical protein
VLGNDAVVTVIETSSAQNCSNNVSCQRNYISKVSLTPRKITEFAPVAVGKYRKRYGHFVFPLFVEV